MAILHQIITFIKSKTMNFKLVLAVFIAFTAVGLSAQELTLKLSQHPNKQAVIGVVPASTEKTGTGATHPLFTNDGVPEGVKFMVEPSPGNNKLRS